VWNTSSIEAMTDDEISELLPNNFIETLRREYDQIPDRVRARHGISHFDTYKQQKISEYLQAIESDTKQNIIRVGNFVEQKTLTPRSDTISEMHTETFDELQTNSEMQEFYEIAKSRLTNQAQDTFQKYGL